MRRSLVAIVPLVILAGVAFVVLGGSSDVSALAVPRTEDFPETLGELELFDGDVADLVPADGYHLIDLESSLFVDDSDKQRLISVPDGTQITIAGDGLPVFPDGTTLVKTFFYPVDERDPALGRRILETRLLVLTDGAWNVATYIWNDAQDDGTILLDGGETDVEWIDGDGRSMSTTYQFPNEHQCVSCHQQADVVAPIGPELRNLNVMVERDGSSVNQLVHLQEVGVIGPGDLSGVDAIVDYFDETLTISDRARAYLDMNCAHCHNPDAWERPAGQGLDLRWETPLDETGIERRADNIVRQVERGQMPFMGTTIVDETGVELLRAYLNG